MATYKVQDFVPVGPAELLGQVQDLQAGGYRLVQMCCTRVADGFELTYTFDLRHTLKNLRLLISEDTELQSISHVYWPAFIYENEMKDLFGVKFKNMALDYGGHFFKVSQETPWNPKKAPEEEVVNNG